MAGADNDERASNAIESLAMEVSGMANAARRSLESRRQGLESGRQRLLDAARAFSHQQPGRDVPRATPEELWQVAMQNGPNYQPQWMSPSQMSGRMRNSNGIQLVPLQPTHQLAHVPAGAGEGRAIRATQPIPRDNTLSASSRMSSRRIAALQEREAAGNNNRIESDGPARRAFGFRVAFDHPNCEPGGNLGGCYLVGVTVSSFTAYGEQAGLSQSAFFWGVEDGGNKYEGARYAQPNRGSRRLSASYSTEIDTSDVPMNNANLLFGSREVVTVICDLEARTLTFWRGDTLLGTLVHNLPRSGNLYPVAVPFNCGVAVAITGLDGDPLPILRTFTADAKRLQKEKEEMVRREVIEKRQRFFRDGAITPELRKVLNDIFALYTEDCATDVLDYSRASRLFYRCGMKLDVLDTLWKESDIDGVTVDNFCEIIEKVLQEEKETVQNLSESKEEMEGDSTMPDEENYFRIGDKVELLPGYDKFEDAAGGPLRLGERGTIVELQTGPNGHKRSIRVLYNGRRWWYQPQAIISEGSGLIDSSGVWFVAALLRYHGYDSSSLESLDGIPVASFNIQVGDVVVPTDVAVAEHSTKYGTCMGRIAPDSSSSSQSSSGESSSVMVEYVNPSFGPATGASRCVTSGSAYLEKRRVRPSKLLHSSFVIEKSPEKKERDASTTIDDDMSDDSLNHDGLTEKKRTDLSSISRLDGPALENMVKECKKSPDSLATMFSAGLPEALLAATDVAERQMNSLELREDLPERISALGALTLFTSDQLFSVSPKKYDESDHADTAFEDELHQQSSSSDQGDNVPARSNQDDNRDHNRRSRRTAGNVRGLVQNIQQRRSLLLSLMSRGSIRQAQGLAAMEGSGLSSRELALGALAPAGFARGVEGRGAFGDGMAENNGPWEDPEGENGESNEPAEASNDETTADRAPNRDDAPTLDQITFLDSIRRKRGYLSTKNRSKTAGMSQLVFQQRLFEQGLLPNSLPWTKGIIEDYAAKGSNRLSSVLRHVSDEEGRSALFLAISFGCSKSIVKYLLGAGAQVRPEEIRKCIVTDQPTILALLLRHSSLPDDFDGGQCSDEVAAVISGAKKRQNALDRKMRDAAGSFMVEMLHRLVKLALQSRKHRSARLDLCSRVISEILVGNVLLHSLKEAQNDNPKKDSAEEEHQSSGLDEGLALGGNSIGLLSSLPASILQQAFFSDAANATNLFLLLEDYLCSRELAYAAAGLTALASVLKHFPQLSSCAEMERYGMLDLAEFHDELASNRCAEILSRQLSKRLEVSSSGSSNQEQSSSTEERNTPSCNVVMCPQKHKAHLHVTRHSSFRCDLCGNGVDRGRPMHGCRECDWDACEDCTDLAESGLLKCAAIRELSLECRKCLAPESGADCFDEALDISTVISDLSQAADKTDVDALALGLLEHDRSAVEELARMMRTPGQITVHQFMDTILPSLHGACIGRNMENSSAQGGHRSKKAKVGVFFSDEEGMRSFSPARRFQFCKELVDLLIFEHGEKISKLATTSDEDSGETLDEAGEGESESALMVFNDSESNTNSGKEIALYAESSELLRRLQQVLSLHERVPAMGVPLKKKSSSGSDLQALTAPIEVELLPSSFSEPVPCARNQLSLKVEPLLPLSELELHVLRGCVPLHLRYLSFCQRLSSDKAIILERPSNSSGRWQFAQVLSFDEGSGTHGIRYASSPGNEQGSVRLHHDSSDVTEIISFGSEVVFVVLAAREYVVVQRDSTGKAQSTTRATAPTKSTNRFVGTRAESDVGGSGMEPVTIVKCEGESTNATCTLVTDSGVAYSGVQITALRAPGIPGSETENEDASIRMGDTSNRGNSGDALVRAFPFFAARTRSEDTSTEQAQKSATALKRTWSALSLADALSPFDLAGSEDERKEARAVIPGSDTVVFPATIGKVEVDVIPDINKIEMPPTLEVRFNVHEKLPGIEFPDSKEMTLVRALSMIHQRRQGCGEFQLCGPHKLFFAVSFVEKVFSQTLLEASIPKVELISNAVTTIEQESITDSPKKASHNEPARRTRQLSAQSPLCDEGDTTDDGLCEGLNDVCVQCMEVIDVLSEAGGYNPTARDRNSKVSAFANDALSKKLVSHLEDPLAVVGGVLPEWCTKAPSFAPRVFTYSSRKALLDAGAFGVSRSTYKQQESKINIGKLRNRMASLRGRAVELVGEAFSGGAEDPTALQLQADELYGMEEALAARVRAMFRAAGWQEHSLQVAKAAVRRENLLLDASVMMDRYTSDKQVIRRRLEVRFEGESGFDAAAGDEAGVTRGFYADVAEALLSSDIVAGVHCSRLCSPVAAMEKPQQMEIDDAPAEDSKLPLWIPDMDSQNSVTIPTPRADEKSAPGVFPRPLPPYHPQMDEVLKKFRFMGRLFASAMRDGFMFPLPLSSSFLKMVQHSGNISAREKEAVGVDHPVLSASDLPRPGFLGGEIYAADAHICRALDKLDAADPPLSRPELQRRYNELSKDKNFARIAFGKTYDCSFEDYYQDRVFVDPLDPGQDENAVPLCSKGFQKSITIYNVREWVALSKKYFLHDGVLSQANAFRQGVEDFFPSRYLGLFTAEELQYDVCGVGDNVEKWDESSVRKIFKLDGGKGAAEALVAVAAMGGEGGAALSRRFGPSSPTIAYLVKTLLEKTPQERRQFLSFVTSVPIVTPGKIEVVPIVSPSGDFMPMRDPGCLPRANTCARRLYLPKFDDYETFCKVLWAVVREESNYKGFYEWRG